MFKEAARIFENLANIPETGTIRLRALRKAIKSERLLLGATPNLRKLVEEAEQCVASDRLEGARLLMVKALAGKSPMSRSIDEMIQDFVVALRIFEEEYSLLEAADALHFLGVQRARLGMTQEGLAESLRSISLYEELGDFRSQMEACFFAGLTLNNCMLWNEAFEMFAKVIEIDEEMKTGEYMQLTNANAFSSLSLANTGDFERALAYSLKALELSEKTDSAMAHGMAYSNLTMQYTRLGDVENAEKYREKLMKLPQETLNSMFVRGALANAVFFAGKNQWEKSNRYFNEYFNWIKSHPAPPGLAAAREIFAWALERQGRFEEAKVQLEESREIHRGGEMLEHADLRAHLMVRRQVVVGEEFEMRLDIVNVGRKPALLIEVKNALLDDLKVSSLSPWCNMRDGAITMKNREIRGFQVNTVKLKLKSLKVGTFTLEPQADYMNDFGQTKTCKMNTVNITVLPAPPEVRPDRVSSGTAELDDLLLGGIPEKYSVILTAGSGDERELLIKRFLETAAQADQTTLHLTTDVGNSRSLAEKFPDNFSLFLCSPQAELVTENLPSLHRLKSVDNLTEIDIALAKYFRTIDTSKRSPRIVCVQIVSDVLLQHHAVVTRKWLTNFVTNLKSKGFTTLAVIDPRMHPAEETQAVLDLFDGEISIYEKETPKGSTMFLKVKKMTGQKYSREETPLTLV
jgi:tetratricopeptide (TPR) repeat protein/KaiC/GvpD/RAD55 family RecA-like ATPase